MELIDLILQFLVIDQLFQFVLKRQITIWEVGYLVHHVDELNNESNLLWRTFDVGYCTVHFRQNIVGSLGRKYSLSRTYGFAEFSARIFKILFAVRFLCGVKQRENYVP